MENHLLRGGIGMEKQQTFASAAWSRQGKNWHLGLKLHIGPIVAGSCTA
jgi:hypothetical protein